MKTYKFLITGGCGFIGHTLIDRLNNKNANVDIHILDIAPLPKELEKYPNVSYHNVDTREREKVRSLILDLGFDGIVHLAAVSRVEDGEFHKEECVDVNYGGTKNIVDAIRERKALGRGDTWLIFGSSREVYGEPKSFPVNEEYPLLPINNYGHTKLEGELLAQLLDKYVVFRFSNVYGNLYDRKERILPIFVNNALQGDDLVIHHKGLTIDFTYVEDVVYCIIEAMKALNESRIEREIIQITPSKKNDAMDVANFIVGSCKSNSNIRVDESKMRKYDVNKFIGDGSKAKKLLGIEYTPLEVGLKNYISLVKKTLEDSKL